MLRSLEALTAVVQCGRDPYSALKDLVRVVTEVTPWDVCWASLFDPSVERVVLQHGSGFGVPFGIEAYDGWPVKGSLSAQAIESGLPITITDMNAADQHPLVQADAAVRGFRSALVLPLQGSALHGALWLCRTDAHEFTDTEHVFAYAVASHIATALQGAYAVKNDRELQSSLSEDADEPTTPHPLTARERENLERISAIHERLMRQVLDDHSVAQLAEVAAQVLEKPVVLFDRFDHVLCTAGSLSPPAIAEAEALLSPQLRTNFTNRLIRASFVVVHDQRYLVVPIASEGRALGNLCVLYGDGQTA